MKRSTNSTSRIGVHAVGLIFHKQFGWIFREQHVSDFGIDAQVEVVEAERVATGQLFALQIKSGSSWFKKKGENYVYYGENRHLEYWLKHSLPVFIILHDPDSELTVWQRVERQKCEITEKGWIIEIPHGQVLSAEAKADFISKTQPTEEEQRRLRFALDRELIEEISRCHHTSFDWEVDADPGIGITELWIRTINKDAIYGYADTDFSPSEIYYAGHNDVAKVMQERFWWATYGYNDDIDEHDDGSETHSLWVLLREEVWHYLQVDKWLTDGPPVSLPVVFPQYREPTPEESFRLALEADWEEEASAPPEDT